MQKCTCMNDEMEEEEMERREGGAVLKDSGKVGGR